MFGGVTEAILSIPKLIIDGLSGLLNLILAAIKGIGSFIWDFFKDPIGSLVDGFKSLLDFLDGLISGLVSAFGDLLKLLFVPSDTYFDKKIDALNKTLSSRIQTQDYEDLLHSLQFASRARAGLPNLTATIMGHTVTVVDMSFYAKYQGTIYSWVRGFIFFFLILYNLNNIYKLVRKDNLQTGQGSNVKGGGDG